MYTPILLGTNRSGRQSEFVAHFLEKELLSRNEAETELFDVRDFNLPRDDYGEDVKASVPQWAEAMKRADGLIIVSPEYNHSFPGILKSVLDTLFDEYKHKPVGIAGVSSGGFGGVRMMESLSLVLREFNMVPTRKGLPFSNVEDLFDKEGNIKDGSYRERAQKFFDEFFWYAKALKWGRENI